MGWAALEMVGAAFTIVDDTDMHAYYIKQPDLDTKLFISITIL